VFTGLVEEVGTLARLDRRGPSARAHVRMKLGPLALGESVSVSGTCLTVNRIVDGGFEADLSAETLELTTLGGLALPARVNLERATPLGGRMGGHVVLGHVDATGRVVEKTPVGDSTRLAVEASAEIAPFVATKGSIAVEGVSLTINHVKDAAAGDGRAALRFDVMLVPHTLGATTLLDLSVGQRVNLEVDVLARYVMRQLGLSRAAQPGSQGADDDRHAADDQRILEKLKRGGYV
jgi:riboflavin synthase